MGKAVRTGWLLGLVVALGLGLALAGHSSSVAVATNFAGCTGGGQPCFANNSNHGFAYQLGPRMRQAMENTRLQSYHTTNLTTRLDTRAAADVFFFIDDTLPQNVFGRYECIQFSTLVANACHRAEVRFNGGRIAGFNDNELWKLACHETGHTVGLWHPTDPGVDYGCMVQGQSEARWLMPHNTHHINSRY
jgi:hypothetical protein